MHSFVSGVDCNRLVRRVVWMIVVPSMAFHGDSRDCPSGIVVASQQYSIISGLFSSTAIALLQN
jgi:hypothetical protein